jgi:hypothetical protein
MGDKLSPIFIFLIFAMMKEEIYKISFKKYNSAKFKDHSSIFPKNNFVSNDSNFDIVEIPTQKHPFFKMESSNSTEECFVENFVNPLYSVLMEYVMVVVEKNDHKVCIKMFQGYKSRREGKPWFKVNKNVNYISVNTKTGDVYHGYIHGYQKKKKCSKSIRRNCFINDPLNALKSQIKNALSYYSENAYDDVTKAFSEFMFQIDQRVNFENLNYSDRLLRFYLNKRGIKYPNNFNIYTEALFGPEIKKLIKKKNNRLVDAVMVKNGLTGKKVKKALHECTNLNINLYITARKLFGEDWLNQDGDTILDLLNSTIGSFAVPELFLELVTTEELKRVYTLFKQTYVHQNLDVYTFVDHIRMYTELKMFGEHELRWTSFENKQEFRKEHLDWTDKIQHYKKGSYIRHYPEYMYEMLSQPLLDDFHSILLDSSSTYNEESNYQSNCVKGYIGKPSCLIISVRCGQFSEERATIEYSLTKKDDKIFADRVQSLGKFNQKLEAQWTTVLLKLDQVVLSCVRDERFETVKLTKECNNGAVLNSDTYWNNDGKLRWVVQNIDNSYNSFFAMEI